MSMPMMNLFSKGNGIRSLTPVIVSHFSARTKASTVDLDNVNDTEKTVLENAKPYEEVPSIKSFPVIGSSWVYFPIIGKYKISALHLADIDKYKKFGKIFRETFGPQDIVSIFDPVDVEKMFREEGQYPMRGELMSLKAYRESRKHWYKTSGIMILEGKEWYDLRSKVQTHMMHPKFTQAHIQPLQSVAQDFTNNIAYLRDENKEVPHFLEELYKWALESVAVVGLDTRLGCLGRDLPKDSESLQMITAVQTTFECMNKMELFTGNIQYWKLFPTPLWRRFVKAKDFFTITGLKYVNKALEDLKNKKDEDKELTLLQSMLCTPGLDPSGAMTTVMDLLLAGIDSTSNAVGFLLYHLAKNPNVQEKLHEEIAMVLPNHSDKLNSAALNELRYMKACLKESLRINPVVRGNVRKLDHGIVLSGYRIPAGVIIAALNMSSRLEKYFKNPNKFIPERWLNKEEKGHPFLFVPFGFGRRSCLGRRLAELEILCLVTEIVRSYKVEYHHEDIGMLTRILNVPDRPLKFSFIDRP